MGTKQDESQTFWPFIKLKSEDGTENIHYLALCKDIPSEFLEVAKRDLNETEEIKREGLERMKDLLRRERITDVDEDLLLVILRCSKHDFAKAETKLKKLLKFRKMVFDKLQTADMKRLESVLDHKVVGFLPYRDKYGSVIIFTTTNFNLELFGVDDAALCFFSLILFGLTFPLDAISGVVYMADFKTPNISICYSLVNFFRKHAMDMLSVPLRLARIHYLNENFIVKWGFKIIRVFLPAKLVKRVSFYGSDLHELHKFYHPDILPDDFGGTMGPLKPNFYKEELMNFMERLKSGIYT